LQPAPEQKLTRISVLGLIALAGMVAIALVIATGRHRPSHAPTTTSAQTDAAQHNSSTMGPVTESAAPTSQLSIEPAAALPNSDPSAVARRLVNQLSEVDMQSLTPEAAAKWQQNLESLVEQGTAAIPPLQEFFQSQADIRFDSGSGTNLLGEPSLRVAFIEVLFNIPAPENVNLQAQLLHETTNPDEVALLGRQLELQDPGTYRELIVWAAQKSLREAQTGQWPGRNTDALLKILNQHAATDAK